MMFKAIMVQAVKKSTLLINGYHNLNKFTSSKSQALELLMFQNWNFIDNSRMLHGGNLKFHFLKTNGHILKTMKKKILPKT